MAGYAVVTKTFTLPSAPVEWVPYNIGNGGTPSGHMAQVVGTYSAAHPHQFTAVAPAGKVIVSASVDGVVEPNGLGAGVAWTCTGLNCYGLPRVLRNAQTSSTTWDVVTYEMGDIDCAALPNPPSDALCTGGIDRINVHLVVVDAPPYDG